jgi:hypothetical protein
MAPGSQQATQSKCPDDIKCAKYLFEEIKKRAELCNRGDGLDESNDEEEEDEGGGEEEGEVTP